MARKSSRQKIEKHKQSLGDTLEDPETHGVRTRPRQKRGRRRDAYDEEHVGSEDEEHVDVPQLPSDLTNKIMREAHLQQEEIKKDTKDASRAGYQASLAGAIQNLTSRGVGGEGGESDDELGGGGGGWSDEEGGGFEDGGFDGLEAEWAEEVDAEDEAVLAAFRREGEGGTRTLADMILEKIREKEAGDGVRFAGDDDGFVAPSELNPKVVEVYRGVGALMSRYTSGKVPKAFKVIPNLKNWEEILYLTEPELWSPHAVYQATKMFVSNLNSRMAQRFLALVLLPHVRNDIEENKRLHFALFQALKKATFKAGAFYKGILLPLCSAGDCTLREAVIITSVIRRSSIPVLHSAAAVLRIAEMPYSGVNSFFIRVLLDKRYSLPYRVIDALVDHFVSFTREERQLPVVWHQALLCFVQRYKSEIRREDKDTIRNLCKVQNHYLITPEVFRELEASRSRGEKSMEVDTGVAQNLFGGLIKGKENPRDCAELIMMDDD